MHETSAPQTKSEAISRHRKSRQTAFKHPHYCLRDRLSTPCSAMGRARRSMRAANTNQAREIPAHTGDTWEHEAIPQDSYATSKSNMNLAHLWACCSIGTPGAGVGARQQLSVWFNLRLARRDPAQAGPRNSKKGAEPNGRFRAAPGLGSWGSL